MEKPAYLKEIVITILCGVWFHFVATNVNTTLGTIYQGFAATSLSLLIIGGLIYDKNVQITYQKSPGGTLKSMLQGFGGWIVLLITSVFALKFIDPTQASFGSVLSLMGATTPALAESKIANFLTFAVFVPLTETNLWARALEFISDLFGIPIEKRSFKRLLGIIVALAFAFMLFHLTAKGITAYSSLTIVFLMMLISLILVVYSGESRDANWLHIFANSAASYIALFSTGSLIL
jgi:hypothetical protein